MTSADGETGDETDTLLPPGSALGSYRVEAHLASGGMAHVYVAEHLGLGKRVALKVLKARFTTQEEFRQRFLREGMAASIIRHPNVVDVHDVREEHGLVYLVMELLQGESLEDLLRRRGVLTVERAVDLMLPVIAALGAAHRQGVVHRDLKPDNIFLTRDLAGREMPKVLDFGISKIQRVETFTVTQSVLGTPHYMSPEQARGDLELDGGSDQFSTAMVLYELVTGRLPYASESVIKLIHEVARGDVPPPRKFNDELPGAIDDVVMRALRNVSADRYPTMESFGRELLPFASPRARAEWSDALSSEGPRIVRSEPPPSIGAWSAAPRSEERRARDGEDTLARALAAPPVPRDAPRSSTPVPTASGPALGLDGMPISPAIAGGIPPGARIERRSRRPALILAIGGAIAVIALLVWWLVPRPDRDAVAHRAIEVRTEALPVPPAVAAPPRATGSSAVVAEPAPIAAPAAIVAPEVETEPAEPQASPRALKRRPVVRRPLARDPGSRDPEPAEAPTQRGHDDLRFSR